MKIRIYKSANYIGWIVIILAFAFLYFTYFFIYIPNQEAKLQQRAFRILKEYGNNMFDKNNYYQNHFKNYGLYYKIKHFGNTGQLVQDTVLRKTNSARDVKDVIDELFAYVELESTEAVSEDFFVNSYRKNKLFIDYRPQISDTISQQAIDSVANLYFPPTLENDPHYTDSLLSTPVQFKVPVDILMQGLKFDRLFENIILFDDSLVYYNSNSDLVADITNPEALCDSVENVQGGIWEIITIRGEDKHVMILPIDFLGKRFCIAGLIVDDAFRSKTRTINNQFLILIAAILLLIFIGMPILKIIFIGEKERLKAMDASGSAISTIFGSGLLVLIAIGVIKHQFVDRSQLENRLKLVSDSLYTIVSSDIDSIKNLYLSIIDSTAKQPPLAQKVSTHFNRGKSKFYQLGGDTLDTPFPLNEILIIQPDGIVHKAVTRTPFSDVVPLDLNTRNYFTQVVKKAGSWPSKTDDIHFYIESIKSYNTAKGETAFSFHNTQNDSLPVTAITSAVPSLYYQVLPKDIEYVIINSSGDVLYHSIKSKNLHENFVAECETNSKLIKTIDLRVADIVHINYNEKKWMARIVPVNETPLYHITLLDINQTDNKNARIFLFTFYFLFASLVFVGLGMLGMRWLNPVDNNQKKPDWFLSWLLFQGNNYRYYIYLSILFTGLILVQNSSILFIKNPVSMLVFQLIFIIYSSFISLVFLKRKELQLQELFSKKYYPENIILLVTGIAILTLLLRFHPGWEVYIPLALLIVFTLTVPKILQYIDRQPELSAKYIAIHLPQIKIKYLAFLFLWLTSISAIPVVQYYFSIKKQEEKFWKQDQLLSVAADNLELKKNYPGQENTPWFRRIQGNGIDNLKVEFKDDSSNTDIDFDHPLNRFNKANEIYSMLPDPVNEDYSIKDLHDTIYHKEWDIDDTLLTYSRGGTEGVVDVISNTKENSGLAEWFLSIFVIFSLLAAGVWILLRYVARVLLNLTTEHWEETEVSWKHIFFEDPDIKRILLHSFNGDYFLKKLKEYLKQLSDNNEITVKPVSTTDLTKTDFDCGPILSGNNIIWISGFDQSIYEIEKHEPLLKKILEMCQNATGKIIVDIPFDLESIDEFYNDYIFENEIEKKEITRIYLLKKRWKTTFKNFFEFNGYLNHKQETNPQEKTSTEKKEINKDDNFEHQNWELEETDTQFSNIWDNLTGYEKIVLYDLADDGLLNRKNKNIIQRLANKKLIIPNPYPKLFSEAFRDFVNDSLEPSDVKAIEKKLGFKGKWRNIQYLILLILVPMATFIFISQGISIEKIFGIFAGVLTIITGVMRLFDSQVRQSAP